jgi:hypothetical protein
MMTRDEIAARRAEWLKNAKQQLEETDAELVLIAIGPSAWEHKFKLPFPGPGYTDTMRAQAKRLAKEIARHEEADRNSR